MHRSWSGLLPAGLALLGAAAGQAQGPPVSVQKLFAPDGEAFDHFGFSTEVEGDWIVLGADGDDDEGPATGAAYVFARSGAGWTFAQKLHALDGPVEFNLDLFGTAVDVHGDLLVVSAPGDTNPAGWNAGSLFVFENQGGSWVQSHRLWSPDTHNSDHLGFHVALSDSVLAATANNTLTPGPDAQVIVFERQGAGWVQTAQLFPSDTYLGFGEGEVAVSDETIFVAAYSHDEQGFDTGRVYVFEKRGAGWLEVAKLAPDDPKPGKLFGWSLALDGARILIGAPTWESLAVHTGSAYVFERLASGWTQTAKLTANDDSEFDGFGSAVALQGGRAVVGAELDDAGSVTEAGSIYTLELVGGVWEHVAHFGAPDPLTNQRLGSALALSGDAVLAPAALDPTLGPEAGAAYAYDLDPTFIDLGHALAGSAGLPALAAKGTLQPGTTVEVSLAVGEPLATGSLVLGLSALQAPFKGGTLVPFPDALLPWATDAGGAAMLAGSWPAGVPADTTLFVQWWVAEAAGAYGFAASNAIGMIVP